MSFIGKPSESEPTKTPEVDTKGQEGEATPPANPGIELSDDQKSYLKGIGIEDLNNDAVVKVIENAIKQKSSVSKFSLENEQLKARLESQGKPLDLEEKKGEETPPIPPAPTSTPEQSTPGEAKSGVSDNDLFDLSRMIMSDFPEIKAQAEDGSLFKELRTLGYFTAKGVNKKELYEYLSVKNAGAKELRELREFREEHSKPDQSAPYTPSVGLNLDGEMTTEKAREIVLQGNAHARHAEAVSFLQKLI